MARTTKSKKKKNEEEEIEVTHFWESMDPRTIRAIVGILLFVIAVFLLLGATHLAGVAGDKLFDGLYWLVGVGYYIAPFLLVGWAWMLFNPGYAENTLRPIRAGGAVLFFVSVLGTVGVLSQSNAGVVGRGLAQPLVTYVDTIAALLLLTSLILVSLLLLTDSALWLMLWNKCKEIVARKHTSSADADLAPDQEPLPLDASADEPYHETPVHEQAEVLPEEDDPDEDDTPEDIEELGEEPLGIKAPKKTKRAPAFEPPTEYIAPPASLLESDKGKPNTGGDTKVRSNIIRKTLQHFKIPVEMDEVTVGPTVTRYALKPAAGVRLSKIVGLQPNLELALAASPIRIEAPIPGRSLVGIEVPNTGKSIVGLGGLVSSPEFTEETLPLFVTLGKDISGAAHYANVSKMPHMLVAGTTGSGKSVMIHSIVASLLYRNSPERLKLMLIDPKRVELTLYDGIPHLLTPVITDAKKCILALKWAAKEMDRRYDVLRENRVQDINGYHNDVVTPALSVFEKQKSKGRDMSDFERPEEMPHIVIIIDELADIMTSYPRELEGAIVRLAQMSRAVGIHLILSTQRPSVNVITGLIKANIPTRLALKVASLIDSRTILDQPGAEKLLGAGDMLYLSGDMSKPRRLQSPFLTTTEVKKIVDFLKKNNAPTLGESINFSDSEGNGTMGGNSSGLDFNEIEQNDDLDELYEDIRAFVIAEQRASTSLIQRRFKVGYGRAARIMDQLEQRGVIDSSDGTNKPRKVSISNDSPIDDMVAEDPEYAEDEEDGFLGGREER